MGQEEVAPALCWGNRFMKDAISVIFITYNRADLLVETFHSIKAAIDKCELEAEYIVSDDGSEDSHRAVISGLPFDRVIFADRNQGLGANCNKGLAAARFEYILQIQDDREFCGRPESLLQAIEILKVDARIGIVQLSSSMEAAVKEEVVLLPEIQYVVFENDQMMIERPCGLRPYSDQPHMKRREFCRDIGLYREGIPMTDMELDYQKRVANQDRWYVAALKGAPYFRHTGIDRTFNPSIQRAKRIQRLEAVPVIGPVLRGARSLARAIRSALRGRAN